MFSLQETKIHGFNFIDMHHGAIEISNGYKAQSNKTELLPQHLSDFGNDPGHPLPPSLLQRMEDYFNTSFAEVRIHIGPQPASIGAIAFACGSDLYFSPGIYNPYTKDGLQLLAHELTHVIQQREGRVVNPFGKGIAIVQDDVMEAEADYMGYEAMMNGTSHRKTVVFAYVGSAFEGKVIQCALTSFKKGVNGKKGLKEIFKDDDGKYYFLGGASTKEKEIWKGVTLNADGSNYEEGGADKIVEKGPVAAAGWSEFKVVNAFKSGGVMPIRIFPTVLGFKEVHATTNRNNGEYPSFHVKFDVGTGVPGTTAGYISCFYKYPSGNFANYGQNEADRKKIIAFVTKNNSGEKFSEVMSALRKEADSIAGILMNSLK